MGTGGDRATKSAKHFAPRGEPGWESLQAEMTVVTLTPRLRLAVPLLALASLSKSTRGFSLYPGRGGEALGVALMTAGAAAAYALFLAAGVLGAFASAWLLGTAGAVTLAASLRPTSFVKPICVRCRLLPVIKEHEAIHLSGVFSEGAVWASMRARHTSESLSLAGDPGICTFCPIPKRLAEH